MLRIGAWCVHTASGQISRQGENVRLEERAMRLLLCLARRPGEVVSIDDLLSEVWAGVTVSPDSVYQAVASLRRQLGDDARQPAYIATVPRLGYRMVAAVSKEEAPALRPRVAIVRAASALLCLALAVVLLVRGKVVSPNLPGSTTVAAQPQNSIAVLPFLDLTDKMAHEIFADAMTEEVIDKLSRVPGLRVPAPRTSFFLKGKKMPIAEVGRTLSVAYVLDGSIRQAGAQLRVAARLIRTDNGYVVWSQTYERPWENPLKVPDDVAVEVARAVKTSLEGQRSPS
jgi:transcriptional activator of cad operon